MEDRKQKIDKAKDDLDYALTDDDQHVIVVLMNSRTNTMSIELINTMPELANELLRISVLHTQEPNDPDMRRRMN